MQQTFSPSPSKGRHRSKPTSRGLLRYVSGQTLQTTSSATGVSVRKLSEWENGKRELDPGEERAVRAFLSGQANVVDPASSERPVGVGTLEDVAGRVR